MSANDNEGPFSIGQNVWPGVAKLMEESAEVIQVCAKLLATGGRTDHWSGRDLKVWLEEELGDLGAAIDFVRFFNALDEGAIEARTKAKFELFLEWHNPPVIPLRR